MKLRLLACLVVLIASTLAVAGPVEIAVNGTQGGTTYLAGPKGVAQSARVRLPLLAAGQDVTVLTDGVSLQGGLGIVVRGDFKDPTKPIVIKLKTDASVGWSGTHTFSGPVVMNGTMQVPSATTLPTTCSASPAEVYVDTDAPSGQRLFVCESNNTWVPILTTEFRSGTGVKLYETDDSNWVAITTPSLVANWTLVLPQDDGDPGDVLCVPSGDGVTDWCTPGGGGDITQVWTGVNNDISALTAAPGDTFDAGSADSSKPATRSTSQPGTCTEGQLHQDTDSGGSELYVCTAPDTWVKLQSSFAGGTNTQLLRGVTGSDPIWQNKDVADVRDFGVVCDSVTDYTIQIQAAIDSLPDGGVVDFPQGSCVFSSITVPQGITLRGKGAVQSNDGTILRCSNLNGVCINVVGYDTRIEGFSLKTTTTPSGGNVFIDYSSSAGRAEVDDVFFISGAFNTAIRATVAGPRIANSTIFTGSGNWRAVHLINSVEARLDNVFINTGATNSIYAAIDIESTTGTVDTLMMNGVTVATGGADMRALWIHGGSGSTEPRWIYIGESSFEGGTGSPTMPAIDIDSGRSITFTGSQIVAGKYAFNVDGGKNIRVVGSTIGNSTQHGLYHNADADLELTNTSVVDSSTSSANTYSGVYLTANSRNFRMRGGVLGNGFLHATNSQKYGAEILANARSYVFEGVRFSGNTTAPLIENIGTNSGIIDRNVMNFGAVCDGSTDDYTAVQAAINSLPSRGGVVEFPMGTCRVNSQLVLDNKQGIILRGSGGRQTSSVASLLSMHVSGSGSAISAKVMSGFKIIDLGIRNGHASFTGTLLDVSGTNGVGDTTFVGIDNAYILDIGGGVRSSTLLSLDRAHTVQIKDTRFQYGGTAILGKASSGSYSNTVSITGSYFWQQDVAPIKNPGDSWVIQGNTFEARADNTSVAITHDSGVTGRGHFISGNIFNDSTTGSSAWITTASTGVNITGNLFAGHTSGSEIGIDIDANTFAGTISNNTFVNLGVGVDCWQNGAVQNMPNQIVGTNTFTTVTTPLGPGCGASSSARAVNVMDFGAKCDGTNDSVALQAAINAVCPTNKAGGTIYVPAKSCFFATTLTGCDGLAIIGSDVSERSAYASTAPHELVYTGTGTGLDFSNLTSVRISGVRLSANSGSFTSGTVLKLDGGSYFWLDRVNLVATNQSGSATSKLISASDVVGLWVSNSSFSSGGYHIYGRAASGNFTNVVEISNSAFYRAEVCSIQNMGDAWSFHDNWWQQQGPTDNLSKMICHDSGVCAKGVNFAGNMTVDQPNGPTTPLFDLCGSGISITGNFIAGNTTQDGIQFTEPCDGCSIQGNWFAFLDVAVAFSSPTGQNSNAVTILGNDYDAVTGAAVGGTRPARSIMQENTSNMFINEPFDIWMNVDSDANSSSGAFVIGSNAASSSGTQQYTFFEGNYAAFRLGNDLRFYDADNSNFVQISIPSAVSPDWTWTLPPDDGSSGYLMRTDGSGVSTWTPVVQAATGFAIIDSTTGSAGNRVLELKNSNVTNTPTEATYIARTTTTDGTQTSVTFEQPGVASGEVVRFKADVVARCTGGASCGTAVGGIYTVTWACINVGGSTSLVGGVDIDVEQESASIAGTWGVTADCPDGSDTGRLLVTGAATSNITWLSVIKRMAVTS
jgi:polygalacturonase